MWTVCGTKGQVGQLEGPSQAAGRTWVTSGDKSVPDGEWLGRERGPRGDSRPSKQLSGLCYGYGGDLNV